MTSLARERAAEPRLSGWGGIAARTALALAYPLAILLAWRGIAPRYVGCILVLLLWLQRWIGRGSFAAALNRLSPLDWCVAASLSAISLAIALTDSEFLLHLYPAFVSAGLLAAFGATLYRGPTMIEKFARAHYPDPSPAVVRYTRRVTQIWCEFFIMNGAFSVYTALYWSRAAWSLYNGAIVYALIGALLAGEWIWRRLVVMPRQDGASAA
jgi:uncharacterized membrane protein